MTAILERAGGRTLEINGKRVSGKRFIAQAVWELATTGKVTLPTGVTWIIEPRDWLETVKWIYAHIDGPPKGAVEIGGPGGGPIQTEDVTGLTDDELVKRVEAILSSKRGDKGS